MRVVLALLAVVVAAFAVAPAAARSPTARAAGCRGLTADFVPSRGNPQTLRVRFTVSRFSPNRGVYLHYVGPNGHLRRSVWLGTARGSCGFLRTGFRRLFPFIARPGKWRLRFTSRAQYRVRPTAPFVTLAVTVLRSR